MNLLDDLITELAQPWRRHAPCQYADPDLFFPSKNETGADAKRICRGCPVRAECLDYAVETDQIFGIWGGLSERQRRNLRGRAA